MTKSLIFAATIMGAVSLASALPVTIDESDFTAGTNTAVLPEGIGVATAGPAGIKFEKKFLHGYNGYAVGTTQGVGGEIDNDNWIEINFADAYTIDQLTVAFLYPQGEFGDVTIPGEMALIFENGTTVPYTLMATSATTAVWTGAGTVLNISPAQDYSPGPVGAGMWQIINPFANDAVTSLRFRANDDLLVGGSADSDFSLYSLTVSKAVPEPGALSLLGLGLLSLVGLSRRKQK